MPKRTSVCQACGKPIFMQEDGKWQHRRLVDSRPAHEAIPMRGTRTKTVLGQQDESGKERPQREIGYLFPHGVTDIVYDFLAAYDAYHVPKEELEELCKRVGVKHSGHKKLLAARLLANEFERREE